MIRIGDMLLIALCALLVGAAFALTWQPRAQAGWAELRAPGKEPQRVALEGEREIVLSGHRGDSVLAVADGRARFVASPCSGKHCIHSGWLASDGEFAACLPNGVSLTLVADARRYDSLAY